MKAEKMLKTPVARRRGAVTQETGSWAYLLVNEPPDVVLDGLLKGKVIGAAHRDCLKDLRAGKVPRPIGPWGVLVRLKGHDWTYVLGDGMQFEWPRQWAARHGWKVALFTLDGMINTKVAKLYEGKRELFDFLCGLAKKPQKGFTISRQLDHDLAMIRGKAKVCSEKWLGQCESGGDAMDRLAQFTGVYLPVYLGKGDDEGKATIRGHDGEPYPDDEMESQEIPAAAFERIDVFTFGKADTLRPNLAAIALGKAVRAGDAKGASKAIAAGADPNVMSDDDESPLQVALGLGSPYLEGGRFSKISRKQQLDLMQVLLKAGAKPDPAGEESAIQMAIHWANEGDEQTILDQIRLLLDHGADPNALGGFLRGAGEYPLHVIIRFDQWLAVIKLLVQRGANLKRKNKRGETPLALAEKILGEAKETVAKHDAAHASGPLSGSERMSTFLSGLMGGSGGAEAALKKLSLNLTATVADGSRKKLDRLLPVVEFLRAAEKGKADFSDIDAIAAASSRSHAKAEADEEKEREEGLKTLVKGKWNLGAKRRKGRK